MPRSRPTEPTEHAEQCAIITWSALNTGKWPVLHLLYAVPNGAFFGSETKTLKSGKKIPVAAIRAHKLKAEGLKEGVPDLVLPVPSQTHHGLYIELKRRTLGQPSPHQTWWKDSLLLLGYHAILCHGATEAITAIRAYLAHCPKVTLPPLPIHTPRKPRSTTPRTHKSTPIPAKTKSPTFLYPGSP